MPKPSHFPSNLAALRAHYPLYLMEAAELALFMLSACLFDALLYHPASALITWNPNLRRLLMGLSMGLTAVAIILSPWGRRSGAHFNPAISLTFYRLGKIGPRDTLFYILAHFAGAPLGVAIAALLLGPRIADPHVNYIVTIPGPWLGRAGPPAAFAAETFMAALMMTVVLYTANRPRLAPWTPACMAILITSYVFFFAPISGFSINPARTFGSAIFPPLFTSLWIYFTAPLLGMLTAATLYTRLNPGPHTPPHTRPYPTHRHLVQRNHAQKA